MNTHILTLVASQGATISPSRATAALRSFGAETGEPAWLADNIACDLPLSFSRANLSSMVEAEAAVRQVLIDEAVDLALQPIASRRKSLLVADMESTIIRNEMLDELADFVGCREQVEEITARAMNGELDFRAALHERVALLHGLSAEVLEKSLERVDITPGAATLVATLRAHGAHTALVSGGFDFFTQWVQRRLGFDEQEANRLEIKDGRLTGRVHEPIRDRAAKLRALKRICREQGIEPADAVTVGDGANDLDMLAAAGLGVAFHAKRSVARAARFRIEYGDLTTLLYFQGFARSEFSTP